MKVVKNIVKTWAINLYAKKRKMGICKDKKKIIQERKNLVEKVVLTKQQIKAVDDIWIKNYGKKISKDWHKLYASYTGIFDEKYFPETFFESILIDKLNPFNQKRYLADKVLTPLFFEGGVTNEGYRTIKNYIYNCNNHFYNQKRNYKL